MLEEASKAHQDDKKLSSLAEKWFSSINTDIQVVCDNYRTFGQMAVMPFLNANFSKCTVEIFKYVFNELCQQA